MITYSVVPMRIGGVENEMTDTKTKAFEPSVYQKAIFAFTNQETGHGVVEAVAGSGKTTTLVEIMKQMPADRRILFCSFNRHIAQELSKKAPANAEVKTLHQLGLMTLRKFGKGYKVDGKKLEKIIEAALSGYSPKTSYEMRYPIKSIIEKLKNTGRMPTVDNIIEVVRFYHVDLPINVVYDDVYRQYTSGEPIDPWYEYDIRDAVNKQLTIVSMSAFHKIVDACYMKSVQDHMTVDFDDMVFLPFYLNLKLAQYDAVLGDEAQDYNTPQIDLLKGAIRAGGRILAVGDRFQSLYGFRGANVDSIPILIESLDAEVLPLSITYRCPLSHVALAKHIVPCLEAGPNAIDGEIIDITDREILTLARPGDMIISRYNASLIPTCIKLIANGYKATVRGKNVAATLKTMLRKFKTDDLGMLRAKLDTWYNGKIKHCQETKTDCQEYQDRYDTIVYLIDNLPQYKTVTEIMAYIDRIFSEDGPAQADEITLSTVHRAKGLEANRVFILYPNQMPARRKNQQPWEATQEKNILYVALTRARKTMYMVFSDETYEARKQLTWIYNR